MPGKSRIITEALKALSRDALNAIWDAIISYWAGDSDAQEVHEAVLIFLPKKGDLSLATKQPEDDMLEWYLPKDSQHPCHSMPLLNILRDQQREDSPRFWHRPIRPPSTCLHLPASYRIPEWQHQAQRVPRWDLQPQNHCTNQKEPQPSNVGPICWPKKSFDTADHELLYAILDMACWMILLTS